MVIGFDGIIGMPVLYGGQNRHSETDRNIQGMRQFILYGVFHRNKSLLSYQ